MASLSALLLEPPGSVLIVQLAPGPASATVSAQARPIAKPIWCR